MFARHSEVVIPSQRRRRSLDRIPPLEKETLMKRILSTSALLALILAVPAFSQNAADIYKTKCAGCHGADGKGNTPVAKTMSVRDFSSPEVKKETEAELIAITAKGKNKMPAYAGKLSDDQIKAQVAYIHSLK
jgi:cytochrome c5